LGRQLDPELDLWKTAKPYLETWMEEQIGWRGFLEKMKLEAPHYVQLLPQLPRLVHQALTHVIDRPSQEQNDLMKRLIDEQKRTNSLLAISLGIGACLLAGVVLARILPGLGFYPF